MNRKKWFKNLMFVVMSLVLALSSVVSIAMAAASDIIDTTKTASLTIHKYDLTAAQQAGVDVSQFTADGEADADAEEALAKYALKGVEFKYLKVGSINTYTDGATVKLMYDVPDDLATIIKMTKAADGKYESDTINKALADALVDNTATKNKLEDYINANSGTPIAETNGDGVASVNGLALGLYLVVETRVPEEVHTTTDPFFVSLPMTDATGDYWNYNVVVYPKNQTNNPTIDKLVSENGSYADIATASEGDVLDYRVVTKLPRITSKASYLTKYTFVDTLSKGIKYNEDTSIAIYDSLEDAKNGTGTPVDTWAKDSANFAVTYGTDNTMTVAMTDAGLAALNPTMTEKYLVVIYKATVQSDASVVLGDAGNPNTVTLTYSRTNVKEENTIKDKANVYSYGLNLSKVFSGNDGDATKVQFVLQNKTNGYYVTATGSEGVYYVTDGGNNGTVNKGTEEAGGTVFSPKADGKMIINGLEADEYVLTEIHTSDGYSLLKEPMTIKVNQTIDTITPSQATITGIENPNADIIYTTGDRASATLDGNEAQMSADGASTHARVDMTVKNTKSFLLPQTGGLGTLLFTIAGAIAVIIGMVVVSKKKKNIAK